MTATRWLVAAFAFLGLAGGAAAEEVAGLPLHVDTMGPGAIRLWVGDHISSTAVVALATQKGIVVVDTVGIPAVDTELRRVIARELGRDDFALLVNTHEHGDHTGGNSVYADCRIVGHEACEAGMNQVVAQRQQVIEWLTRRTAEAEQEMARQTDPAAIAKLTEELALHRLNLTVLDPDARPVPPTTTFSDRLTLDMGDTTLELYWIGGMHSASDIAVFVPQRGLLMTGDTMADVWLTATPGCLASFAARDGVPHDFPKLLKNWDLLLAQKDRIRDLVPGHWNGDLSIAGAEARVAYVKTLWERLNAAAADGKSLGTFLAESPLDTAFPDLASSPGFNARNHGSTIIEMWKCGSGQRSGAARLHELVDQGAAEESLREVLARSGQRGSPYFFLEAELNAYGYRFLQAGKVHQAVALLKLNVELFPKSWNVYDSLGEALLATGDTAAAIRMYEQSLTLNPENTNGRDALARIRSASGQSS